MLVNKPKVQIPWATSLSIFSAITYLSKYEHEQNSKQDHKSIADQVYLVVVNTNINWTHYYQNILPLAQLKFVFIYIHVGELNRGSIMWSIIIL